MELVEVEIIKIELSEKQEGLLIFFFFSFFHYRKQCIFSHKEKLTFLTLWNRGLGQISWHTWPGRTMQGPKEHCVFRNDTFWAVSPLRGTEVTPSRTFYYFTAPTVLECRAASTSIFRIPSSTELKMHFSLKKFLSPKPKKRNSSNNKKVHFDLIASPTRDSFKFHFNPVTGAAKADPKEKGLYKSIYMIYI